MLNITHKLEAQQWQVASKPKQDTGTQKKVSKIWKCEKETLECKDVINYIIQMLQSHVELCCKTGSKIKQKAQEQVPQIKTKNAKKTKVI